MRVIVLGPWANNRLLVVIVILIANIPIQIPVYPEREPAFWRLETHRIRGDQRAWRSYRIGDPVSLPVVFVDSIRRVQGKTGHNLSRDVDKKEIVPGEIQAVALRVIYPVEKVINDGVAVNPVVVVPTID